MPQLPFKNHSLPGRIEIGDCEEGGQGVGNHDLTPETGNDYRPGTAIDLKPRPGGQWATVDTQAGEWTAYTVRVPFGGVYRCEVLVSNDRSPGAFRVQVDGVDAVPIMPAPNTGSRDVYVWVGVPGIRLRSGAHVVKLLTARESISVEAMRFWPRRSIRPRQKGKWSPPCHRVCIAFCKLVRARGTRSSEGLSPPNPPLITWRRRESGTLVQRSHSPYRAARASGGANPP